jgi:hypothetical protein
MPVGQRLEFCRRKDNINYPLAFDVQGIRRNVRTDRTSKVIACDHAADLRVMASAMPFQDCILMVGG